MAHFQWKVGISTKVIFSRMVEMVKVRLLIRMETFWKGIGLIIKLKGKLY